MRAVMLRPSTLTVIVSPIVSPSPPRLLGERRPAARPRSRPATIAGGKRRVLRQAVGIGDAAVAAQHPGAFRRHADLRTSAPVHRRRCGRAASARASARRPAPRGRSAPRRRRARCPGCRGRRSPAPARQACRRAAAQIGVDQRQRDEQRQPEPERQHDARRQRAGPVDVADGEPERRRRRARLLLAAAAPCQRDDAQHDEGDDDGADEDERRAAARRRRRWRARRARAPARATSRRRRAAAIRGFEARRSRRGSRPARRAPGRAAAARSSA